ncbi:hypothetical protein LTS08_006264 [Lithohypha guttulata]|nr:hypothetical protein LTS08_006264 [Lithohypha guttulata]
MLPPETVRNDDDSGYSDSEDEDDPSEDWPEVHDKIRSTIAELGGKVVPKLNWSAPKDATWMSSTNDMECRTPNDIYLLLKSSDFITHDLEQAFDGCIDTAEFLFDLRSEFSLKIEEFFEDVLKDFPDSNFTFDVYLPPPHDRVWLIDINPWAPRTDPLLFSWLELLTMDEPEDEEFVPEFRLVQRDDPEAYQFSATKFSAHKLPKDVVDAGSTPGGMKGIMEEWKRVMNGEGLNDSEDETV